jgi:hypothetical protein
LWADDQVAEVAVGAVVHEQADRAVRRDTSLQVMDDERWLLRCSVDIEPGRGARHLDSEMRPFARHKVGV